MSILYGENTLYDVVVNKKKRAIRFLRLIAFIFTFYYMFVKHYQPLHFVRFGDTKRTKINGL